MADKLVYSSFGGSGGKSAIRKWYEAVVPGSARMERAKHHLTVSGEAIRGGGEGLVVGAILGAAHASLPTGLDQKVALGGGKTINVPADGLLALGALVGSAVMGPNDAVGTDLRNTGVAASAVFSFRKTGDYVAGLRAKQGKPAYSALSAHGDDDESYNFGNEDPVIAAARNL